MTWHYEKNGIRHDNVTEDDITGLIVRGELTATTLVWRQGMTDWQPVSATPLASALLHSTTPPALPGSRIPGGVVWTLAFAPFIGYALELWTAGLNGMAFEEAYEAVSGGQYWFITLLLNIVLGMAGNAGSGRYGLNPAQTTTCLYDAIKGYHDEKKDSLLWLSQGSCCSRPAHMPTMSPVVSPTGTT